jgi:hypothetical protein
MLSNVARNFKFTTSFSALRSSTVLVELSRDQADWDSLSFNQN